MMCDCYKTKPTRRTRYDPITGKPNSEIRTAGYCSGTRENDLCDCGGDTAKCDFYPEKRKSTTISDQEIMIAAINTYGETAQEVVAMEECAELITAICHKHRGREHNIAEEIADVEIMLEQLKIINSCAQEVEEIHKSKMQRLYQRVYDMCI